MTSFRLRSLIASVVAAAAVALIAIVVADLAYFVANQQNPQVFPVYSEYFLNSTLLLFVFTAVFGLVGAFRRWYTALIAGVVSGAVAALVGTGISALVAGVPFGDMIAPLVVTLVGNNLIFVLAAVLASVLLAPRIHSRIAITEQQEVLRKKYVLVRRPAESLADGIVTHIERESVDVDLAEEQWEAYVAALTGGGWEPIEVPVADDLPDSVFVEDSVVMFGALAVLASPGAESREGEIAAVEESVRALGLEVTRIEKPGTLDGGDVLKVGMTVFVGKGGRTNAEGIRQLRKLLAPRGYSVVAVPVTKALHLKSTVTALPDGTVIGYRPLVDDPFVYDRFLEVPEPSGAHVVVLSDDTVLVSASAPESVRLIEGLGYRVIAVDISEFEKLEGCVTCLSVRVR
ncbi:dimethylarginine dimethylaminohydrolase [Herbiconiux sp. VKM Ac-1786]|uniref:dimethylargininase n=1 Tax=Herbiconiux sp. VKM Ac-1786 TaxID=2783824 RepID=UPI00188ADE9D|nr:dimethylargininase [Herbiconiux sp. VKM Ac-1786]MBF4571359.1 dimethylarginine dimethylaminohydrolase [Herbiconiux sp. VKM Ac-1786]